MSTSLSTCRQATTEVWKHEVVPLLARLRVSRAELRKAIDALYPPPQMPYQYGINRSLRWSRDWTIRLDVREGNWLCGASVATAPLHR